MERKASNQTKKRYKLSFQIVADMFSLCIIEFTKWVEEKLVRELNKFNGTGAQMLDSWLRVNAEILLYIYIFKASLKWIFR